MACGFSVRWLLLLWSMGSRHVDFSSCSTWASVVVAHGISCSTACGIFLGQGSNPCPLHWQVDSSPLRHQGSPLLLFITEGGQHHLWLQAAILIQVLFHAWKALFPLSPEESNFGHICLLDWETQKPMALTCLLLCVSLPGKYLFDILV